MSTAAHRRYSPQEYLALERLAEHKSEYLDGAIYARSGASFSHCRITANLMFRISQQLEGGDCQAVGGDLRILIPATGLYTYPDLSVICGEPRFQDGDTLLNPVVIVEVLSPSTESYDRGRKFEHFRTIPSLREYVLVAQDRVLVDRFFLRDGRWEPTQSGRREETLRLESIGCDVPLRKVYDRVEAPDGTDAA